MHACGAGLETLHPRPQRRLAGAPHRAGGGEVGAVVEGWDVAAVMLQRPAHSAYKTKERKKTISNSKRKRKKKQLPGWVGGDSRSPEPTAGAGREAGGGGSACSAAQRCLCSGWVGGPDASAGLMAGGVPMPCIPRGVAGGPCLYRSRKNSRRRSLRAPAHVPQGSPQGSPQGWVKLGQTGSNR